MAKGDAIGKNGNLMTQGIDVDERGKAEKEKQREGLPCHFANSAPRRNEGKKA